MSKETTKRARKVVLSDDGKQNVKLFACSRLNKAVNSVKVFGNCFGNKYEWTDEQIAKAEQALQNVVESAINNLRTGKKINDAGITL